jgi:hypothetical protein
MILPVVVRKSRIRRRGLAIKWLRPHYDATEGGESAMLRYLDDPDAPCFAEGWLKADKNRFHQERAPGSAKKYVFNPNSWVYAFRNSLSAVSAANEWPYPGNSVPNQGWCAKRGVTLITPRHVVFSHGGLQVGTEAYPTKFRFVGTDGESYDRLAIGNRGTSQYTPITVNGVSHIGDSTIITLDADLPAAVIPVRTIPNNPKFAYAYGRWDALFVSQSIEVDSPTPTEFGEQISWYPTTQPFPVNHYPRRHRSMCGLPWSNDPKVGYMCWGGDSGMPLFYGHGTELLFAGFAGGGGWGPRGYPYIQNGVSITWEDLVSALIDGSDDNAIARGKLVTRTGYRCQFANEIPDFLPN